MPAGDEARALVTAVSVKPKVAVPVMVGVPERAACAVLKPAAGLAAEGRCVAVCAILWVKLYDVFAVRPLNVAEVTQPVVPLWYSIPAIVLSVMLVVVLLAIVGAAGAGGPAALATAAVDTDVTVPDRFDAVTFTIIV